MTPAFTIELCPHGSHVIAATPAASSALALVPPETVQKIAATLCDIAELATTTRVSGIYWDGSSMFRVQVQNVEVLYSIGRDGDVLLQHVIVMDARRAG